MLLGILPTVYQNPVACSYKNTLWSASCIFSVVPFCHGLQAKTQQRKYQVFIQVKFSYCNSLAECHHDTWLVISECIIFVPVRGFLYFHAQFILWGGNDAGELMCRRVGVCPVWYPACCPSQGQQPFSSRLLQLPSPGPPAARELLPLPPLPGPAY